MFWPYTLVNVLYHRVRLFCDVESFTTWWVHNCKHWCTIHFTMWIFCERVITAKNWFAVGETLCIIIDCIIWGTHCLTSIFIAAIGAQYLCTWCCCSANRFVWISHSCSIRFVLPIRLQYCIWLCILLLKLLSTHSCSLGLHMYFDTAFFFVLRAFHCNAGTVNSSSRLQGVGYCVTG